MSLLLDGSTPAHWTEAACNTGDASLLDTFYPARAGSRVYARARRICEACPVSAECLDYTMRVEAETIGGRHGFAGGLSPDERHALGNTGSLRRRPR